MVAYRKENHVYEELTTLSCVQLAQNKRHFFQVVAKKYQTRQFQFLLCEAISPTNNSFNSYTLVSIIDDPFSIRPPTIFQGSSFHCLLVPPSIKFYKSIMIRTCRKLHYLLVKQFASMNHLLLAPLSIEKLPFIHSFIL